MKPKRYILPVLKGNMITLTADQIKSIRSDSSVVYITTTEGNHVGNQPLKFYKDILRNENFFQVSQSILINLSLVKGIDVVNQELQLECGQHITMSRNGLRDLRQYIKSREYCW